MRKVLFISAMIFVSQAFAQESAISVASAPSIEDGKSAVQVGFKKQTTNYNLGSNYNGRNENNIFNLNYHYAWGESDSFYIGSQFINRDFQPTNQQSASTTGLGDLIAGYNSMISYPEFNLLYGIDGTFSLGDAQDPVKANEFRSSEAGNNFSGYHTLAPYIGTQAYVGQISVGGTFQLKYYSPLNKAGSGHNTDGSQLNFSGFVEVPLYKNVDIGMIAGLGKKPGEFNDFFNSPENSYRAAIYSRVKIDKDSTALIDFSSNNEKMPYEQNSTDLTLGLRKNL